MHDHLLTTFQVVAVPLSKNMGVRRDTCTVVGRPEMVSMICAVRVHSTRAVGRTVQYVTGRRSRAERASGGSTFSLKRKCFIPILFQNLYSHFGNGVRTWLL